MNPVLDVIWTRAQTFWFALERYWRYMVLGVFFGAPLTYWLISELKEAGGARQGIAMVLTFAVFAFVTYVAFHPRVLGTLTFVLAGAAGFDPDKITADELKSIGGPFYRYAFLFVVYWVIVPLTIVWFFDFSLNPKALFPLLLFGFIAGLYAIANNKTGTLVLDLGLALVTGGIVFYLATVTPFIGNIEVPVQKLRIPLPWILGGVAILFALLGREMIFGTVSSLGGAVKSFVFFVLNPKKLLGFVFGLLVFLIVFGCAWYLIDPEGFQGAKQNMLDKHERAGTFIGDLSKDGTSSKKKVPPGSWQARPATQGTDSFLEIRADAEVTGCSKIKSITIDKGHPSIKLPPAKRGDRVVAVFDTEEFDISNVASGGPTKNLLKVGHTSTEQTFLVNASGGRLGGKSGENWEVFQAPGDQIPLGLIMGQVNNDDQKPIGVEGNTFSLTKGDVLVIAVHLPKGGSILGGSLSGTIYDCK